MKENKTLAKHENKKVKTALKRFEEYRTEALACACEGARSLIITGHDEHCIQHLARMLSAIEAEVCKLSSGEPVPVSARALLVPAARSRQDTINDPRLRLAAMLGAIGHQLAMIHPGRPAGLRRTRESLADVIVVHAQAVLLMADLNAERDRTKAAA